MQHPIQNYWQKRLADLKVALESNNFDVYIADNQEQAANLVEEELLPALKPKTVSWGGSMTVIGSGLYDKLKKDANFEVIDTIDPKVPPEEKIQRRKNALLVDLFITGTNAVTETGQLVNLDMIGNRIGGLTFGPKWVILFIGRNKLVASLDDAMYRIKNFVAPANAMRLDMKTPCVKTSYCEECKSPARICNTWTITEKSFPKGRIKVVLINEDLGL
ncbi:MAG: lactate utilization protein [Deltaproteobacteria bacterium]|nr:lactate utilization protein [Deltaproteobacteria bacterium]